MDFAQASLLLKNPAARLLRAEQAAFALAFLHTAFKESGQTAVAEESLTTRLEHWLAERRVEASFEWERPARAYLGDWCAEDRAWIRKVQANEGLEPAYELTSATEKALTWLESLRGQTFVGTESRLEGIFCELDELLRQTSDALSGGRPPRRAGAGPTGASLQFRRVSRKTGGFISPPATAFLYKL